MVGSGRIRHVHRHLLRAAYALNLFILENSQKTHLCCYGQLPYFIQKNSSSVGSLETASCHHRSPCKSPLLMPEQLTVNQPLGDTAAVNFNQGIIAAR